MIPDSAFASSSERENLIYSAARALTPKGAEGEWCAHYNDTNQWLQAQLSYTKSQGFITIRTFQAYSEESWVTSYIINTSTDGKSWTFTKQVITKHQG